MTNTKTAEAFRTIHVAEVAPKVGYGIDQWGTPDCTNDATKIRLYSKHQGRVTTFSVLFIGPEGVAHNVDGPGKHRNGPWAALIANATVVSARRVPGDAPAYVELEMGDLVAIRGHVFRIVPGRPLHDPELQLTDV